MSGGLEQATTTAPTEPPHHDLHITDPRLIPVWLVLLGIVGVVVKWRCGKKTKE